MRLHEVLAAAHLLKETVEIQTDHTAKQLADAFHVLLTDVVADYQDHVTQDSSSPSGPNTATFRAQHKGMIAYLRNVSTGGGYYSPSRTYDQFVQIGSNVDYKVAQQMRAYFAKLCKDHMDLEVPTEGDFCITSSDGVKMYFTSMSGSAWGGFGYFTH